MESTDVFELIAALSAASTQLCEFLRLHNLDLGSSAAAHGFPLSPENKGFHDAKGTIIEAAGRIVNLVRGPRDTLLALSFEHCASATLQIVLRYRLAHHVPLRGSASYEAISASLAQPLPASLLERVIQHAISFGLFAQQADGGITHSQVSALLVNDPDLEAWLYLCSNVAYPAGAQLPNAFDQYGVSSEANESAYSVSIGRKIGQFEHFREPDGQREFEMFAKAMKGISAGGAYDIRHVVDGGYPWHALADSLVVDVGGGPGHVSMALARKYPLLRFEVQDLPETVKVGEIACPEDLKSRMTFRAHDFFTPQPERCQGTDEAKVIVYFARFILHDWSDKYAKKIIQGLATALRPDDRIILNEVLVPAPGETSKEVERRLHDRDLLMLMNLNGRERTRSAFDAILSSTSPRLRITGVHTPPQGELSLIEIGLAGEIH